MNWKPISTAPKNTAVLLFSEDFIDEDFNPTGVVDGHWSDDTEWTIWQWNGYQDCFDTINNVNPTHWAPKLSPIIKAEEDNL